MKYWCAIHSTGLFYQYIATLASFTSTQSRENKCMIFSPCHHLSWYGLHNTTVYCMFDVYVHILYVCMLLKMLAIIAKN